MLLSGLTQNQVKIASGTQMQIANVAQKEKKEMLSYIYEVLTM